MRVNRDRNKSTKICSFVTTFVLCGNQQQRYKQLHGMKRKTTTKEEIPTEIEFRSSKSTLSVVCKSYCIRLKRR